MRYLLLSALVLAVSACSPTVPAKVAEALESTPFAECEPLIKAYEKLPDLPADVQKALDLCVGAVAAAGE